MEKVPDRKCMELAVRGAEPFPPRYRSIIRTPWHDIESLPNAGGPNESQEERRSYQEPKEGTIPNEIRIYSWRQPK